MRNAVCILVAMLPHASNLQYAISLTCIALPHSRWYISEINHFGSHDMATIVAFVSQKGGVGKSTLARALMREAVASGLTAKLADLDTQQGTPVNWNLRRLNAKLTPEISVEAFSTAAKALEIADQYDLLVIDGPARASQGTLAIAERADLVVQPTGPALDDLLPAVRTFHELVEKGIPRTRLAFALTRIGTPTEETEARDYLQQAGYTVLDGALMERPAYRKAQNGGRSITETRYQNLNETADALVQTLIDRIGGGNG
jgi:chromosome partitioning protein